MVAGYAIEEAHCPEETAVPVVVAVVAGLAANVALALAVSAYRSTAGQPSADWLLGAAGLYLTVLAWAAAVTGAIALVAVDLCSF